MDKMKKLTREERWDWLKENCSGTKIPWDRMVLPQHEWFDEVHTIDTYNIDLTLNKGRIINVPRDIDK